MDPVTELLNILELERLEVDLFRGHGPDTQLQRVFGGQVIGQALVAATQTVEDRICHSLHAYFLRPGDPNVPIIYQVERVRDGRSFTVRRVIAIQHGRPILNLGASFQTVEGGFEHQLEMPDVLSPEDTPYTWQDLFDSFEGAGVEVQDISRKFIENQPLTMRFPDHFMTTEDHKLPLNGYCWFKTLRPVDVSPIKHQCMLAYASDINLLDCSIRPHGVSWTTGQLQMASLDHAMWFHAPVKTDDWLLYVQDSPSASGARGFNRGSVFSRDGKLVASVAQEGLIREIKR